MDKLVFKQKDFEKLLVNLGYYESVCNKEFDKRSYSQYNVGNNSIKFIKSFCKSNCTMCPSDKTSLWLTSTGYIKECSYFPYSIMIENWQYEKIAQLLGNSYDSSIITT